MFESNFPVEKRTNSYGAVWNAFKCVTQGYSAAERKALFHDTAARVYQLGSAEDSKVSFPLPSLNRGIRRDASQLRGRITEFCARESFLQKF